MEGNGVETGPYSRILRLSCLLAGKNAIKTSELAKLCRKSSYAFFQRLCISQLLKDD